MRTLNNSAAPSESAILNMCRILYREGNSPEQIIASYLYHVASNDFSCPDACDRWAVDFWCENEEEITDQENFSELRLISNTKPDASEAGDASGRKTNSF